MKKNNKGFTLVELLAAVVILGILLILGLPNLLNMLQNNKNKLYVTDAQKLISQAELKMRSNSSSIEKPAEGDCLVFTLLYLDDSVFNTPPNEGKYLKDASFVVVKNNGNDLEYSVTLIEEMKKGGYRGVELTRNTNLEKRSSLSYVKSFSKNDIVYVNGSGFTVDYLNGKLGTDYIGEIENVYDKADYSDNTITVESHAPVIKSATLTSTSNKNYNSLDATLNIKVEDEDTSTSEILLYISRISFDEALKSTAVEYGNQDSYSQQMVFNKSDEGTTINLYIVAKDTDNNTAKKVISYTIHNNEGPEILVDSSGLTKSDSDNVNLVTAKLKLQAKDDVDNISDLNVCFAEGSNVTSCSNYRKYRDVFGSSDTILYTFNREACSLDGSTVYLTVFVKDNSDIETSHVFSYTLYRNNAPTINNVIINSNGESFTSTQSLNVQVQVDANDDLTAKTDLDVILSDGVNSKTVKYNPYGLIDFTFGGSYDGLTRNLNVTVRDSCGLTTTSNYDYSVYKNKIPTISNLQVVSDGVACPNEDLCPLSDGGTFATNISFNAYDDIDSDVEICISESSTGCNNYFEFDSYNSKYKNKSVRYTFTSTGCDSNYNCTNQMRKLYVVALDSNGERRKVEYEYKLYKNKGPIIDNVIVESKIEPFTADASKNVVVKFDVKDDFSPTSSISYSLNDGESSLSGVLDNENFQSDYTFSGAYDGGERTLAIALQDGDGLTTTSDYKYLVYADSAPSIEDVYIESDNSDCGETDYCPFSSGNYKTKVYLSALDDIDVENNYSNLKVCLSDSSTGCNNMSLYTTYDNYYNKGVNFTFNVGNKPFDGSTKKLYVSVVDSSNLKITKSYDYTLYKNVAPTVVEDSLRVESKHNDNDLILKEGTLSVTIADDLDGVTDLTQKICYKLNNSNTETCLSDYVPYEYNTDFLLNVSKYSGQTFHLYSYIKDTYGAVTKTDTVDYKIYKDVAPVLESAVAVLKSPIDEEKVLLSLNVTDYLDTYSVCIRESYDEEDESNNTPCTYSGTYSGDSTTATIIQYTPTWDVEEKIQELEEESGIAYLLYVSVKDSNNNETDVTSAVVTLYEECGSIDLGSTYYEYTPKTTDKISASRCGGKCYYGLVGDEANNSIEITYTRKITYRDSFASTTKFCDFNGSGTGEDYTAYCDFKDCFYNSTNNNYQSKVIGTTVYDNVPWTLSIGGKTYICYSYYNQYLSSYNDGDELITLTRVADKICKEAVDDGQYAYDENSSDPYLRAMD